MNVNSQIRQQMTAILPQLQRFAFALTGSHADAEDLLQATCLRAIENLDKWHAGTRLDSWMYRLAQNIFKNEIRHNAVKRRHQQAVLSEDARSVDGVNEAVHKNELQKVALSIEKLPQEQRTVLLLVAVEGYGYKEAAEILDVPMGTITSRLSRARKTLTDGLEG